MANYPSAPNPDNSRFELPKLATDTDYSGPRFNEEMLRLQQAARDNPRMRILLEYMMTRMGQGQAMMPEPYGTYAKGVTATGGQNTEPYRPLPQISPELKLSNQLASGYTATQEAANRRR